MKKKTITILEVTRREILTQVIEYSNDIYTVAEDREPETNIAEILAYMTALSSPQKMKQMLNDDDICPAIIFDIGEIEDLLDNDADVIVRIMDDDEEVCGEDGVAVVWLELNSNELGQW